MFTRLRIIWLTRPSETPSQVARCSRGIIGWSVMMSSVRFSAGLTPKAGAACAMRSGRGSDARFRSGDWVRALAGGGAGGHAFQREERAADHERRAAPEAKVFVSPARPWTPRRRNSRRCSGRRRTSSSASPPTRWAPGSGRFRGVGCSRTPLWPSAGRRETGAAGRGPGAPRRSCSGRAG